MTDHIQNNYALNDGFHADLVGLSARFVQVQEEIKSSVAQLGEAWIGSSADGHHEWQMNFDRISNEVQQAAHQAFNVMGEQVGSGGSLHQFDQMASSRFSG